MTEAEHKFCPRCGSAVQPGMRFCASCGLRVGETGGGERPDDEPRRAGGGSIRSRLIVALLLLAIGAAAALWLTRPSDVTPGTGGAGGVPGVPGQSNAVPPGSTPLPAPIVGLTITSPTDGQAVATKEVTVIGLAPPGLTVTQDIQFRPDQHTTVDGTGHWAIKVGLDDGENRLTFRIGDDNSTKKTIRVIYTPPAPAP
jgi:Glucodextranase, domain B/zinc-ribbon domain